MEKKNKKKLYLIIAILGSVLILSGVSYAILTLVLTGTSENVVFAGNLMLVLDETETINIASAVPISDEEGKLSDAYVFSVENTGTIEAGYTIYLDEGVAGAGETLVDGTSIRYELLVNGTCSDMGNLSVGSTSLFIDNIKPGVTTNFELRLWIDYNVTTLPNNGIHKSSLRIVASQNLLDVSSGACSTGKEILEEDDTLGCTDIPSYGGAPNPPELIGDMIPVVLDADLDDWVKADTSSEWYSYIEWEWANAVTVTEANRATLVNSAPGTVIPDADINGMFVWIPRYSYTIGNTYGRAGCGGFEPATVEYPGAFDVKWVTTETTDLGTAAYTGDTAENWFTNSAFCWGNSCDDPTTRANAENREVSGIWVAKFEIGTSDATCQSNQTVDNCDKLLQPITKQNSLVWTEVSISNIFNSVQLYMNNSNGETIYGLSGNNYDTHLIKNTEWGAATYLYQSKYGKYGNISRLNDNPNNDYYYKEAEKELTANSSIYRTSSVGNGECNFENSFTSVCGVEKTLSGTVNGIYDMSGGLYEFVMSNVDDSSGSFNDAEAGFDRQIEQKYYNKYNYIENPDDFNSNILGDATNEILGFYSDAQTFNISMRPWVTRGGAAEINGFLTKRGTYDVFLAAGGGAAESLVTSRVVITP